MRQTFKKAERLSSKKTIEQLFESGRSFTIAPFKVIWLNGDEHQPAQVQVAFSVPKKNFKRAVDRNKLKRRSREAYRKQKQEFYGMLGEKKLAVMLVYIAKEIHEYALIEKKINLVLKRLKDEIAIFQKGANESGK